MLPRLVTRVFPRAYASPASHVGLLLAANAHRRVAARTFLTTASVEEPATKKAKEPAPKKAKAPATSAAKAAPKRKKRTTTESDEAKAAKKAAEKEKTKARVAKAKARAAKLRAEERLKNPATRLQAPIKLIRVNKDELPPKSPRTAYNIYVQENYSSVAVNPEQGDNTTHKDDFTYRNRELAKRWKDMTEEEKRPYREKEELAKAKYREDSEQWYKTTNPRVVQALRAQGKQVPGKPDEFKRPLSAYLRFHIKILPSIKTPEGLSSKEALVYRGKLSGEQWKNLPEEEKAPYEAEFQKEMEAYREAVKERVKAAT